VFNGGVLSLAEISDRLEIQQLLVDYASAIDQRRFDDLDRVFTPDAYIDYRVSGGVDGDTATARTICFNPLVFDETTKQVLFVGIWYCDELLRTPDGWRLTRRVEEKCFDKLL